MTTKKLATLRKSAEAPFEHDAYTIWLHNKIIEEIQHELWQFREQKAMGIKSTYAACNHILDLPSIQYAK